MTKKNILLISSVYIVFLIAVFLFGGKCYDNQWCHVNLNDILNSTATLFLPFLPLFLFSLITYKMRDEVFTTWVNFAKWWVPLTVFLTLIAPSSDGSFFPVDKGRIAFVMTALFSILSFLIVFGMLMRGKRK